MTKRGNRSLKKTIPAALMALVMAGSIGLPSMISANAYSLNDGYSYVQNSSYDDAIKSAQETTERIAAEGNVLLKNNSNALPLDTYSEGVSIFGISSDAMPYSTSRTTKLADAMAAEGFRVNPTLKDFYDSNTSTFANRTAEVSDFSQKVESSYGNYKDVAIVVWSAGAGGEGYGDGSTAVAGEYQGDGTGTHANAAKEYDRSGNPTGKTLKHELQMYDAELALKEYVKAQGFKKIVYIIASWTPVEAGILEDDDDIDAILYVGAPGETGNKGTAKILSGAVNPSGKTSDTWYRDFTADPTWMNAVDGTQHDGKNHTLFTDEYGNPASDYVDASGMLGSDVTFLDYEEDIYVGYKYYETAAAEAAKGNYTDFNYDTAVVYPYGYGLSYTEYEYTNISVSGLDDVSVAKVESAVGNEAEIKDFTVSVTVKNTGSVAGKEVVEIYANPPYNRSTAKIEKSHVKLVGFAKTGIIQPGKSETVKVTVNMQDLAAYDADGAYDEGQTTGYVLEQGTYNIYALENAHGWTDAEAKKISFSLDGNAYLHLDDWSGEEVENLFSEENGNNYTLRNNSGTVSVNSSETAAMTRLSRTDFDGTFPEPATEEDMKLSKAALLSLVYFNEFNGNAQLAAMKDKGTYTFSMKTHNAKGDDAVATEYVAITDETNDVIYVDLNDDGDYDAGEAIAKISTDLPWIGDYEGVDTTEWTQSTTANQVPTIEVDGKKVTMQVADLAGIDPYSDETLTSGKFKGKTGREVYTAFLNSYTYEELSDLVCINQKQSDESKGMNALGGADNCHNFGSTFEWGANVNLADTWNVDLAYLQGNIIGNICRWKGNNAWWGTGFQVHRHYFAGRNHEYFAEDAIQVGLMAGAEIQGTHASGTITIIKHAMLNDQETNRGGVCPYGFISEQAFREIYLKAFQMGFQEGGAQAVMTSMSRIGKVTSGGSWNFQEELIHREWGCPYVSSTTDIYMSVQDAGTPDLYILAGSDNLETSSLKLSGEWVTAGTSGVTKDGVYIATTNGTTTTYSDAGIMWYGARKAATTFLVLHANTAINKNGVYYYDYKLDNIEATQGVALNESVAFEQFETVYGIVSVDGDASAQLPAGITFNAANGKLEGKLTTTEVVNHSVVIGRKLVGATDWADTATATVSYSKGQESGGTSYGGGTTITQAKFDGSLLRYDVVYSYTGTLPEGVTFDSATGAITGTPLKAGTYTISVVCTVDDVIASSAQNVTITVAPTFELSDIYATVGSDADLQITSSVYGENDGYTLTIVGADGLPLGMSFDGDAIVGAPLTAGDYTVTLDVLVKQGNTQVGTFAATVEISVEAEQIVNSVVKFEMGENDGEYIVTYANGETETISVASDKTVISITASDEAGKFVVNYSDGTNETVTINTETGGSGCNSAIGGGYGGIAGLVVVLAALGVVITVRKTKKESK